MPMAVKAGWFRCVGRRALGSSPPGHMGWRRLFGGFAPGLAAQGAGLHGKSRDGGPVAFQHGLFRHDPAAANAKHGFQRQTISRAFQADATGGAERDLRNGRAKGFQERRPARLLGREEFLGRVAKLQQGHDF